jgi:FixJ family two-component response regulator
MGRFHKRWNVKTHPEPDRPPLVAIVDDDDSVRSSAWMLVTSLGFRSEPFARAREFLESPLLDEVSCVILDVLMPDVGGLELQRQLACIRPRLPIIFITAVANDRDEAQAMAAGAVAMLRKPVTEAILLQALRSAMSLEAFYEWEKNRRPQPIPAISLNTTEDKIAPAAEFSDEELFDLELRISRRADELAKAAANGGRNLEHWLQAERDILAE